MNITIKKRVFNDKFYPYLKTDSSRFEVYYGSAGSGKSLFVADKLVIRALQNKHKILCLRKIGRTVKQSIFQLLLDRLAFFQILPYCIVNKTDFTITLPNGSIFLCSGLDDAEKIKSIVDLTNVWLEEATEFTQDDFTQLDLRLRHPSASAQQIFLTFNPVSKAHWIYKLFFSDEYAEEYAEFRTRATIIHSTYRDNKFLPQSYIDTLLSLAQTNPAYYTIYAEGQFGSLEKLVYHNWRVENFDIADISGHLLIGLDFGFVADPTVLLCSILDEENNRIYVYEEMYGQGLLNNQIANAIRDKGYSKSIIVADSAEQKSIEEIRRAGIIRIKPATKGQGSVLQGIQKLQQYEIIVSPSCENTIVEFQNYSWKKDKVSNEYTNTPIDQYNHALDALRYSLQCHEPNKKLSSLDIRLLGL